MVKNREICWMSATDLARQIRRKKISPVEVVKDLLEAIDQINPRINAYVTVDADRALAAARKAEKAVMKGEELGPLHGIPLSIKDAAFTKGVRTTMGSKLMENFIPQEDSEFVARLKKAGAILLGKTNTPEFATVPYTENRLFGVTRNPWNPARSTGGSSGGAGAAVAAGLGPLASGNDVGGSIRIPSSCCGVFGIKPQYGRVPNYPIFHLWESMLHEGPITRTVPDAALMLEVMSGPHPGDRHSMIPPLGNLKGSLRKGVKGLKMAWSADLGFARVSREVQEICAKAARKFVILGAKVEEADPGFPNPEMCYVTIVNAELSAALSRFGTLEEIKDQLTPRLAERLKANQSLTALDYLQASFTRRELASTVAQFFEKYDLLLTPTIGVSAWPIDLPLGIVEEVDGMPVTPRGWLLTFPFNLTGQPAASIPAGWTKDGLPVGLQIVGRYNDEATIFRAAAAFEEAQPWAQEKPSFS